MQWFAKDMHKEDVSVVLFDFDGTISTLRCGWEEVMEPMMVEMITGGKSPKQDIVELVRAYIDESTGIQTIFQMKWLVEIVKKVGMNLNPSDDPWEYKAEYNRRLMLSVRRRRDLLLTNQARQEDFMMSGSESCLKMLTDRGVQLYVASGTDDADVKQEVEALGLSKYFTRVTGAPAGKESCSKEAVIRELIEQNGVRGSQLAVVGDGKVEIMIGKENGARTLGVASDEKALTGINPAKRTRLIKAGADAIVGDFTEKDMLERFFFAK
jgi:phosphoglycolate phosphatase-like HAD superfamily hydrolase